ncbi:MAG: hypothetical protein AB7O44_08910 [Hyphomicrobiaceae bacterium]
MSFAQVRRRRRDEQQAKGCRYQQGLQRYWQADHSITLTKGAGRTTFLGAIYIYGLTKVDLDLGQSGRRSWPLQLVPPTNTPPIEAGRLSVVPSETPPCASRFVQTSDLLRIARQTVDRLGEHCFKFL